MLLFLNELFIALSLFLLVRFFCQIKTRIFLEKNKQIIKNNKQLDWNELLNNYILDIEIYKIEKNNYTLSLKKIRNDIKLPDKIDLCFENGKVSEKKLWRRKRDVLNILKEISYKKNYKKWNIFKNVNYFLFFLYMVVFFVIVLGLKEYNSIKYINSNVVSFFSIYIIIGYIFNEQYKKVFKITFYGFDLMLDKSFLRKIKVSEIFKNNCESFEIKVKKNDFFYMFEFEILNIKFKNDLDLVHYNNFSSSIFKFLKENEINIFNINEDEYNFIEINFRAGK